MTWQEVYDEWFGVNTGELELDQETQNGYTNIQKVKPLPIKLFLQKVIVFINELTFTPVQHCNFRRALEQSEQHINEGQIFIWPIDRNLSLNWSNIPESIIAYFIIYIELQNIWGLSDYTPCFDLPSIHDQFGKCLGYDPFTEEKIDLDLE